MADVSRMNRHTLSSYISSLVPITTEADDAVPMSAKHLERVERVSCSISWKTSPHFLRNIQKKQRAERQSKIATIAKEALKPAFKKQTITKEQYKEIMKKVVTKVCSILLSFSSNHSRHSLGNRGQ